MESVENESETRSHSSSIDYPKEKINSKPAPSKESSKKLGLNSSYEIVLYRPYDLETIMIGRWTTLLIISSKSGNWEFRAWVGWRDWCLLIKQRDSINYVSLCFRCEFKWPGLIWFLMTDIEIVSEYFWVLLKWSEVEKIKTPWGFEGPIL